MHLLNKLSNESDGKNILLLQGPVGPFFSRFTDHLTSCGHNVQHVVFHAGDYFFSRPKQRVVCFGGGQKWRQWLTEKLDSKQIDVIIFYGSERPAHKIACELGKLHNVEIISLEEGYIRTGYITVEKFANNSNSPLAGKIPDVSFRPMKKAKDLLETKNNMLLIYYYGTLYFNFRGWFSSAKQRELFHRHVPLVVEWGRWIRNIYRKLTTQNKNDIIVHKILNQWSEKYFIIPLQVAADVNLQNAAMGWDTPRLIKQSIISFAKAAPSDMKLVFKVHPMERGHSRIAPLVVKLAKQHNVSDRVIVIDDGSLGEITSQSAGMITINSSSGLSAIFHGVPLLVIGKAIYTNSVLAVCANGEPNFDEFWNSKHVATPEFRKTYLSWIVEKALVPGDYYSGQGIDLACKSISEKIFN